MNLKRLALLIDKERIFFLRSKKIYFLLVALFALGMLQIALSFAFNTGTKSLGGMIYATFNTYGQFFAIAMASILAAVICGEKENNTWNYYLTKTFTRNELVISKIIFYNLIIMVSMLFVWLTIIFLGIKVFNLENNVGLTKIFATIIISLATIFVVINFEIFISGISKKNSISALSIVIFWILLLIINVLVPTGLGRGYLAPFAQNSFQTSVVQRLLEIKGSIVPFEYLKNIPGSIEVFKAAFFAVMEGLVFIVCAIVFTKTSNYE